MISLIVFLRHLKQSTESEGCRTAIYFRAKFARHYFFGIARGNQVYRCRAAPSTFSLFRVWNEFNRLLSVS
jgi:hypothetical protein